MRIPVALSLAVALAGAATADTIRKNEPPRKPAPGSLLVDTLRREGGLTRMAMVWAPGAPSPARARAKAQGQTLTPAQADRVARFYDVSFSPTASWLDVFAAGGNVRVSLAVENASIREALKHVFDQAKLTHSVDADVPEDARVTIRAANVQLHTALNLITEAAGVGWTIEHKVLGPSVPPGAAVKPEPLQRIAASVALTYRIGKSVSRSTALSRIILNRDGSVTGSPALKFSDSLVPYAVWGKEERSTFTCPHCKVQSTLVRVKHQPKCPKCERLYQPEWQFCPADGTKRPAPPVEWRYCPSCGKQVQPEKAEETGSLLESVTPPTDPGAPPLPPLPSESEPVGFIPRVGPVEDL